MPRLSGNLLSQAFIFDFADHQAVGTYNSGIQLPSGANFYLTQMLFSTTVNPNSGGSSFSLGTTTTPQLLGVLNLGTPAAPGNSFSQFGTTTGGSMDGTLNIVWSIVGDFYTSGILIGAIQYFLS